MPTIGGKGKRERGGRGGSAQNGNRRGSAQNEEYVSGAPFAHGHGHGHEQPTDPPASATHPTNHSHSPTTAPPAPRPDFWAGEDGRYCMSGRFRAPGSPTGPQGAENEPQTLISAAFRGRNFEALPQPGYPVTQSPQLSNPTPYPLTPVTNPNPNPPAPSPSRPRRPAARRCCRGRHRRSCRRRHCRRHCRR